jgi:hypothetical protein
MTLKNPGYYAISKAQFLNLFRLKVTGMPPFPIF